MGDFKVDQQSAAVAKMAEAWPIVDALVGGTAAMRKAGTKFLPQWPSEENDVYKSRLNSSVLFNAFPRTTEVLAAKPFARPIKFENIPAKIEAMFDNIDLMGTDLHAFAGQAMLACLRYGIHGVLVDSPKADGVRTVAEEKKAGVRPYLAHYPCASILGWRAQRNANGSYLTQLRLKETVLEADGPWGETTIEQVRVLEPGQWQVWRGQKGGNSGAQWELYDQGATTIQEIPFVFFYGLREDFGIGKPPLQELAYANVEHWQSASDQQNLLHVARVPILFAKKFGVDAKIVIGSQSASSSEDDHAELKYVEHSGAAIGSGAESIKQLEDRMRQVGAELLVERQGDVTATEVNSEDEDNRSTMQKIVEEFEDSLETCLKLMALWTGDKSSDPEVEVFKDFNTQDLSGKTGDLLMAAVDKKIVSRTTARRHLKRADVLAHDLDDDEEDALLDQERQGDIANEAARIKATAAVKPPKPAKAVAQK